MLNVVEFSLRDPHYIYPFFQLERHLRGATARIFEPNDREDITDYTRWSHPTHRWHLSVRGDGIGILEIEPVTPEASVILTRRGSRPERVAGITHVMNSPIKHLLLGVERPFPVPVVFKAVCALKDEDPLMKWVTSSRPRRV